MYVCMYACMHACMHVYIYIYTYTCVCFAYVWHVHFFQVSEGFAVLTRSRFQESVSAVRGSVVEQIVAVHNSI